MIEEKHLQQRITSLWEIYKALVTDIQTSARTIQDKIIFIQGAYSQNDQLTENDFKEALLEVDLLNTEQMLKNIELSKYEAALAELNILAELSKVNPGIGEAEEQAYKACVASSINLYVVDKGKLIHSDGEHQKIAFEQIQAKANTPERLAATFKAIIQNRRN